MIKFTSWPEKKKPVFPAKKQEVKAPKKPEKKVVKEKPLVEEDLLIKKLLEEE